MDRLTQRALLWLVVAVLAASVARYASTHYAGTVADLAHRAANLGER